MAVRRRFSYSVWARPFCPSSMMARRFFTPGVATAGTVTLPAKGWGWEAATACRLAGMRDGRSHCARCLLVRRNSRGWRSGGNDRLLQRTGRLRLGGSPAETLPRFSPSLFLQARCPGGRRPPHSSWGPISLPGRWGPWLGRGCLSPHSRRANRSSAGCRHRRQG